MKKNKKQPLNAHHNFETDMNAERSKILSAIEGRMPHSLFAFYFSGDISHFNGDVLETARVKAHLVSLLKVVS